MLLPTPLPTLPQLMGKNVKLTVIFTAAEIQFCKTAKVPPHFTKISAETVAKARKKKNPEQFYKFKKKQYGE